MHKYWGRTLAQLISSVASRASRLGTDLYGVIFEERSALPRMMPTLRVGATEALRMLRARFSEVHVISKVAEGLRSEVMAIVRELDLSSRAEIPTTHWHFYATREEKIAAVERFTDIFVDDRADVLRALSNDIRKIQFVGDEASELQAEWFVAGNWSELFAYLMRCR